MTAVCFFPGDFSGGLMLRRLMNNLVRPLSRSLIASQQRLSFQVASPSNANPLKRPTTKPCVMWLLPGKTGLFKCIQINENFNQLIVPRCEQSVANYPAEAEALTVAARSFLASEESSSDIYCPSSEEHLVAGIS